MKKHIPTTRALFALVIGLYLAVLCPGPAKSSEVTLSLPGTLWKMEYFPGDEGKYCRFLATKAPAPLDFESWLEVVIYDYDKVERGNNWLVEGSRFFINTVHTVRYEGDVLDGETIKGVFQNLSPLSNGQVRKFTLTKVSDPEILARYEDIDHPKTDQLLAEKSWNLKKDDPSLMRTLWKYQAANGNSNPLYWNLSDRRHHDRTVEQYRLYTYGRYHNVEEFTWRQEGSKVFFSMRWGDYEGEWIDWATIKGVYRPNFPAGKATDFKLFRITALDVLARYTDPQRPQPPQPTMHSVYIDNPNDYSVSVTVRNVTPNSPWKGVESTWEVSPKDRSYSIVPNGSYEIYFTFSNEPKAKYQGDDFKIADGDVTIRLVSVSGGNYGIRRVN